MEARTKNISGALFLSIFFLFAAASTFTLLSLSPPATNPPADQTKNQVKSVVTEAPSSSTPIPPSSEDAKTYIKTASSQVKAGNYPAAILTLKEAIAKYPTDLNLQLTLEYYETEAARTSR